MLIFLDTEFTDFIDCELISIGMVSADGQHVLYYEVQDFDHSKCNAFVQSAVCGHLGLIEAAMIRKEDLEDRLREWFTTLPRSVTIAYDSQHDRDLLDDVFGGKWPVNFSRWYDLRSLTHDVIFNKAVAQYHTHDRPWHHALHDAKAQRAGWLAWMKQIRKNKYKKKS